MNTPVSFELAKLLEEKGFAEVAISAYNLVSGKLIFTDWDNVESNDDILIPDAFNLDEDSVLISAPTIAEVVMWFHKTYGIWISVQPNEPYTDDDWCFSVFVHLQIKLAKEGFDNPDEAYTEAIEHCLNELI